MDPIRRNILATGVAAAATAAAPQMFAQQADQRGPFKFYEKGNVRIRYQEVGNGFPFLVAPGGGLNSRISNWQTAVINAMDEFKNDFRCITAMDTIEKYLHNLYRARPDFVYSVSREFARNCQTPMLVLPDDTAAHAYQVAIDVASLAPKAEITVYPWKDPPELKARTINRVRTFLKSHLPAIAAR